MAIYIDKSLITDGAEVDAGVLQYVITQHTAAVGRLQKLKDAYLAKTDEEKIAVPYPRYIVESLLGYYLGDPVKYTLEDGEAPGLTDGKTFRLVDGRLSEVSRLTPDDDITPVLAAYNHETISDIDSSIGRDIGIFGEAYELLYSSDESMPRSVVCDPRTSFMVRDNSVDHAKLFFVTYAQNTDVITGSAYNIVYVYTKDMCYKYHADEQISTLELLEAYPHYFGEVPAVEYQNNSDRLGDFELQMALINAYDDLVTYRLEDKAKFIDSVLALYGASLEDGAIEALEETKFIDGLPGPSEARLEYVQKTFDEEQVQILANNLVQEIQKQSFVVDMADAAFGTASGQALRMKLFGMTVLIKNKIRALERGLKKRFEMYNHFLMVQGLMGYVSRDAITPIFTISVPVDENGIADIVAKLNGIVDRETLLSLLWFVKDPAKAAEKVKAEAAAADESYLDAFGITANRAENVGTETEEE